MSLALRSALTPKRPAPTLKPVQAAVARVATAPSKPVAKAIGNAIRDSFEPARSKPKVNLGEALGNLPSKPVKLGSPVRSSGPVHVGTKAGVGGPSVGGSISAEASRNTGYQVNRSGTLGGQRGTQPNNTSGNPSASATLFEFGDKIKEGLSVGNDKVGASLGVEASYNAEASFGKDGLHVDIGGEVRAGAEAHASHSEGPFSIGAGVFAGGRAGAGVNFDVGPDGIRAGANASAFLGVEGSVTGGIHTDSVSVEGTLTGQIGVGADAHANVEVTPDGHLHYDFGAGLALGLGGKAGFSGDIDLVELAEDVKPFIDGAQDVAENVVEGAQDVAENVVEGVADFFGF